MIQEKDCKVILGLIEIFIVTLSTAIRISHYNLFNVVAVKFVSKQCCLMLFFFSNCICRAFFFAKTIFAELFTTQVKNIADKGERHFGVILMPFSR